MSHGDIVVLAIVGWLTIRATPYVTYLYKEAEIFDLPRSYLLEIEFFSEALDCWECSSMHGAIMTTSIAVVGTALWELTPMLGMPFFLFLVTLASASWRFHSGLYNSDTDSTE